MRSTPWRDMHAKHVRKRESPGMKYSKLFFSGPFDKEKSIWPADGSTLLSSNFWSSSDVIEWIVLAKFASTAFIRFLEFVGCNRIDHACEICETAFIRLGLLGCTIESTLHAKFVRLLSSDSCDFRT